MTPTEEKTNPELRVPGAGPCVCDDCKNMPTFKCGFESPEGEIKVWNICEIHYNLALTKRWMVIYKSKILREWLGVK
jgi:hypothetical protein